MLALAVDGTTKDVGVKNKGPEVIVTVAQRMRDSSTGIVRRLRKPVASQSPSIQGMWDPSVTYEGFEIREGKIPANAAAAAVTAAATAAVNNTTNSSSSSSSSDGGSVAR